MPGSRLTTGRRGNWTDDAPAGGHPLVILDGRAARRLCDGEIVPEAS